MRLTLSGVLWAAVAGLTALLAGLYFQLDKSSAASVDASALQLRHEASERVSKYIEEYLSRGGKVVAQLDAELKSGKCTGAQTESCLLSALLANPDLSEISFTEGKDNGFSEEGETQIDPVGRRQVMIYRTGLDEQVCTREVRGMGVVFTASTVCRGPHQILSAPSAPVKSEALDPTEHDSFRTPTMERFRRGSRAGETLWTDLSYSQLDETLLEPQRRVVVTALRAVDAEDHHLLGVVKVSLLDEKLRWLVRNEKVNAGDQFDPYRIFIADDRGRLVTPLCESDVLKDDDDDLRISSNALTADVAGALAHASLGTVEIGHPSGGDFLLDGRKYFVSYRQLADTQGWRLGIVGPEDYYRGPLDKQRAKMLYGVLVVLAALFVGGLLALRVIRRAFLQIEQETRQMSRFDFAAGPVRTPFADVRDTLFSLEKAKTAVRAMGRYVPLALVRRLFEDNAEPVLGGTLREVTIFFSDIEGFTTRAEAEPPDVVARWLGQYLAVMTTAVHAEGGTVDKFIGDSVMALWNAPKATADHIVQACRAALRCQAETLKLYQSPEWAGRAPLVTRIGLHVDSVMVGHFGAPDRLSYTAIGDGVNLASRLEGLNKQYGTTLLASEEVFKRARHRFAFRRLDTVAVKGKSQAIGVYELLGELEQSAVPAEVVKRYEEALGVYCAGDFAKARSLLVQNPSDGPSRVLAERCGELERNPPAQPWAGISFAHSK